MGASQAATHSKVVKKFQLQEQTGGIGGMPSGEF